MTDEKKGAPITEKTRYSDAELAEFKAIIEEKLVQAKAEYNTLREVVINNGTNDIEDTSPSFKTVLIIASGEMMIFSTCKPARSTVLRKLCKIVRGPV